MSKMKETTLWRERKLVRELTDSSFIGALAAAILPIEIFDLTSETARRKVAENKDASAFMRAFLGQHG